MSLPDHPPQPIASILAWPPAALIARLALASAFVISGAARLLDWKGAVAEASSLGLAAPELVAAAAIATQLAGSGLFLWRRTVWLGAGILATFTAIATLTAHPFWLYGGAEMKRQTLIFFEHLAVVGGLAAAAILADRPVRRKL